MIELASLRATVYRCRIETPVVTAFGIMDERPMVLVQATDRDGSTGWGEIWCNYPSVGAEHRARIVNRLLAKLVERQSFTCPAAAFAFLTGKTEILALQSGEPGPFAQCIAGIDIALWDLAARRLGLPLWRMLGGTNPTVAVYASGLNPDRPERLAAIRAADGFRAFKQKIGFGQARDIENLTALRHELGAGVTLMADANQSWSLETATHMARHLEPFGLAWLEEPLRADRGWPEWQNLAAATTIPLAAGENLAGNAAFDAAIGSGAFGVIQPDIAKWGGFSAVLQVAQRTVAAGLSYCPHWLGGGVGLLASAHLLAAVGGTGALEIDANPNPLRSLTCGTLAQVKDGRTSLSDQPGLGADIDETALASYRVTQ